MADTRPVQLIGFNQYVALSLDGVNAFSGTVKGASQPIFVYRTDANVKPEVTRETNGRPVPLHEPVERQTAGFYWGRGVGTIEMDDFA